MSDRVKFWLGALLAVPALIAGAFLANLPSIVADAVGAGSAVTGPVSFLLFLLEGAGLLAMLFFPRTRWWAIGLLAGLAIAFILLAGTCVVLLAVVLNAEGS